MTFINKLSAFFYKSTNKQLSNAFARRWSRSQIKCNFDLKQKISPKL